MTALTRSRVTAADLLWVAWHRHRWLVVATAVVVAAGVATMLVRSSTVAAVADNQLATLYFRTLWRPMYVGLLFGVAIAVFWGAPLLSREYEARTNLVAWGQDVTATRWLAGQVALLGGLAACLAAVVGLSMKVMTEYLREWSGGHFYEPFTGWFEVAPHLQVGYVLFGFALGLAAGALTRRTIPAMVIALFGFLTVRVVVLEWVRPYLLPPVHTFEAWNTDYQPQVPDYAMYVASGYADANGEPVAYRSDWACDARPGSTGQTDCLKANGVAGHFADFQPVERVSLFQWIETGIFVVLAAALLVLAWTWVKRARRV
ncbi:MAG TPA: hypothetical protein VNO31_11755 [Umezawaea sp.]|nr:hypothetical protein [Umezawaea sp.]